VKEKGKTLFFLNPIALLISHAVLLGIEPHIRSTGLLLSGWKQTNKQTAMGVKGRMAKANREQSTSERNERRFSYLYEARAGE